MANPRHEAFIGSAIGVLKDRAILVYAMPGQPPRHLISKPLIKEGNPK